MKKDENIRKSLDNLDKYFKKSSKKSFLEKLKNPTYAESKKYAIMHHRDKLYKRIGSDVTKNEYFNYVAENLDKSNEYVNYIAESLDTTSTTTNDNYSVQDINSSSISYTETNNGRFYIKNLFDNYLNSSKYASNSPDNIKALKEQYTDTVGYRKKISDKVNEFLISTSWSYSDVYNIDVDSDDFFYCNQGKITIVIYRIKDTKNFSTLIFNDNYPNNNALECYNNSLFPLNKDLSYIREFSSIAYKKLTSLKNKN